ncbi:MAG: RNA polymerase sigma factor [Prolixibacteraceae bacterium]
MAHYSNEELLRGIQRNNNIVLRYIYKSYYHKINTFVNHNSGDEADANDIFQEAVIIIYRKLKNNSLQLENCTFETYLYSVCKYLWLKQLEKRKNTIVQVKDISYFSESIFDEDLEDVVRKNERYKLFQDHYQKLGKDCQKILQLFFDKVPIKQIAEIMGLVSESYAKKRKHQCKEYLVRSIKQDTEYKNIIENG